MRVLLGAFCNLLSAILEKMNHGRFDGHVTCKIDGPGEQTISPSGVGDNGSILCQPSFVQHTGLLGRLTSTIFVNLSLKPLSMNLKLHSFLIVIDPIEPNLEVLSLCCPLLHFSVDVFPLESAHAIFLETPFLKPCRVLIFPALM
jgi:hypothetical protein